MYEGNNGAKSIVEFICTERNLCVDEHQSEQLLTAISKRITHLEIEGFEDYKDFLQVHPQEYQLLFDSFFSKGNLLLSNPQWAEVRALLQSRFANGDLSPIRAWVVGCDVGEEVYFLAASLAHIFYERGTIPKLKIFATDIDEEQLIQARNAQFDKDLIRRMFSVEAIKQFFVENHDKYVFSPELRKSIIFGKHDITRDAAIGRMDLIICRRTLSYLSQETQFRTGSSLVRALNERGYLFLDDVERLDSSVDAEQVTSVPNLYHKGLPTTSTARQRKDGSPEGIEEIRLIENALNASPVATVCVDASGTVALANSYARATFNILPHDIGKPLQDLELSYRPIELRSLIDVCYTENRQVIVNRVVKSGVNRDQIFDLYITPLNGGSEPLGVNVQFQENTEMYKLREDLLSLNQQLQTANEELQSAHEELETTNEELHSTNEELETTNEELQATNEELETMNEELQSTNTELEFSNSGQRELASAIDGVNVFLESIFASMRTAIMVTDKNVCLQIWNQRCTDLWGLRLDEVRDVKLFDLDLGLPVGELKIPCELVIAGRSEMEELRLKAINRRGQPIDCQIRVTPLINSEGCIVVVDIVEERSKN